MLLKIMMMNFSKMTGAYLNFNIEKIGAYCKGYRIDTLCMTLTEFANINEENIKNIWAFENGKANNIKYLKLYYDTSLKHEDQRKFLDGLLKE